MIRIVKFAKKSWYLMIAIVVLLVGQAFCELALPEYTSNIVDVGIQNSGIGDPVPNALAQENMEQLLLFLDEEETTLVQSVYSLTKLEELPEKEQKAIKKQYPRITAEGIYLLDEDALGSSKEEREEKRTQLKERILPAEMLVIIMTSEEESYAEIRNGMLTQMGMDQEQIADPLELFAMMPVEQRLAVRDGVTESLSDMSDLMTDSVGILFTKQAYTTLGVDLEDYQMDYLGNAGTQMIALALLAMVIAILVGYCASKLAARTGRDLRNKVFNKVVGFSNAEMGDFSTASLITRCTNDVQQVQQVTVMIFRMVAYAPILAIGGVIKVMNSNASMAWIIAVAVAAIMLLVLILVGVAMPKFKKMQTLVDRLNLVTREILTGMPVIRAFSRERYEEKRFDGASTDLMKTQLFTSRAMSIMMPTMMFIMNLITVLIIWVGAQGIDLGNLQVGDMMAFITYTMQIVMSFLMLTMISVMLPRASVAAARIDEVLNSETLIHNPAQPKQISQKKGEVVFDHVNFRYQNAEEDALQDLNFTAKPGQTTAIIGSTGCGKSTMVQLIPRLFDATEGKITIDGVDVKDLDLHELRQMIGYVPQKGILFSGTIESNIRFGVPDASDEVMKEAAAIAQATDFIEAKEEQYDAPIAQGGTNVSGGQKQRLSIARAIAKKPKIYIFDDSFSALDYKTDVALRKELNQKVSDATVIIVAQRISTILHADKILVMDDGKIVGSGTHEELLAGNEVYRQIAESQLSASELGETGKEAR